MNPNNRITPMEKLDVIYGEFKAEEETRADRMTNALRFAALAALYANTCVNYYVRRVVSLEIHKAVSAIAFIWLLLVIMIWLTRKRRGAGMPWFKYVTVTMDILLLSACMVALRNSGSYLFSVYYLIIAVSALQISIPVTVYSGCLAVAAYHATLAALPRTPQTPDATGVVIITLTMLILAAVTAAGTWRGRALVNSVTKTMVEYTKAKGALSRYVSNHVAESILQREDINLMQGNRMDITVLMSDIRGFTALSENMEPEKVVEILNIYFAAMIDIIFRNNGTLDKFIGDAIMVLFGAPFESYSHAELAVKTAVEMQEAMANINKMLEKQGLQTIQMGIGLSAGPAVVGDIGSEVRREYTAIGRTVNLAQRLESNAGPGQILASESLVQSLAGKLVVEKKADLAVKGFVEKVTAYRILEYRRTEPEAT